MTGPRTTESEGSCAWCDVDNHRDCAMTSVVPIPCACFMARPALHPKRLAIASLPSSPLRTSGRVR